MQAQKENEFAFLQPGKESIQQRLRKLFKGRTLRKAAQDWGLPYSTLNNYFSKGATPGLDVVVRVAEIEGVTIEWLVLGSLSGQPTQEQSQAHGEDNFSELNLIWRSLTDNERSELSRLLGRKGADVLTLLLEEHALGLLKLSGDAREAALLLDKLPENELREILRKYRGVTKDQSVSVERKQAV